MVDEFAVIPAEKKYQLALLTTRSIVLIDENKILS